MSLRIVGIIGKPHGTRGEVMVRWVTDYPKTINKGDILYTDSGNKELTVESIREKQAKGRRITLIKFAQFNQPEELEKYRGDYLSRSPESGPSLEKDHYWLDDLEGCVVYEGDRFIGTVAQALDYPANQVLVVDIESTGSSVMVPFVETYIKKVDLDKRKIFLKQLPQYM
ncbi:MAG: ribosome maturation factor RimM [Actinomycetota bacterium]